MPLKPLHDAGRLRRVVATSYQAVSGAGVHGHRRAARARRSRGRGARRSRPKFFQHQIAFNVIPAHRQVRRRRLHRRGDEAGQRGPQDPRAPELLVSPTTVRVPVFTAHSVAVNAETEEKIAARAGARGVRAASPGSALGRARPRIATRCRSSSRARTTATWGASARTSTLPNGLNFWVVGDQLRKGAALNASRSRSC